MVNSFQLLLVLILIAINKSDANEDNNNNNDNNNTKRPNYRLINELALQLFGSNTESPTRPELQFRPLTRFDNKDRMNNNGGNYHNPNIGNSNFGMKRGVPIGGFPPNNIWSSGQNMFGGNGQHNGQHGFNGPYNQIHSNPMLSHLMPQTFNMMHSLRAGLKTGIPAYGFGYGIINDGFFTSNNGFPFNRPFRSSPSDEDSDQKPSSHELSEISESSHKISHSKV